MSALSARGHSPAYISRTQSVLSAALGHSERNGWLTSRPKIVLSVNEIAEHLQAPAPAHPRRLTTAELAALIDALPEKRSEHVWRFIVIALNTLARPSAIVDLRPAQVHHDLGLLDLLPPGRRQNKKRRPTIPMSACLSGWLKAWPTQADRFIFYGGGRNSVPRPTAYPKHALRLAAVRAGLMNEDDTAPDRVVSAYTFRRSMARLLRVNKVPMSEITAMLGHKDREHAVTEIYADVDPAYLDVVRDAIDEIILEIEGHLSGSRSLIPPR